jgi:hypothetical protein
MAEKLDVARQELMELLGEAIIMVKANERTLEDLRKDTASAPAVFSKQVASLRVVCSRDTALLEDVRLAVRNVSSRIRGLSAAQKEVSPRLFVASVTRFELQPLLVCSVAFKMVPLSLPLSLS